ncbi:response regulator transcription factor [Streptomyces sp. NPDC046939]|uniref:response regulator transcription factor n=1 Tax=Streptomyces sp. NPDC046939 TaxID=3155376 RepID=UPI0033D86EA1
MTVRVLLVDDQPLVRSGLRVLIGDTDDLEVAGEAGDGAEAVEQAARLRPDVVVMDVRMPGTDGIEATRRIMAADTGSRVLVLTTFDEDAYVYGALRAGAGGFVVKDMSLEEILTAIRVVAAGDALIAPGITRRLIADFVGRPERATTARAARTVEGVTPREREVLTLIGLGRSNQEIAEDLVISVPTVKSHVARLLTKLDARDRVHLVITAYEAGLVTPER